MSSLRPLGAVALIPEESNLYTKHSGTRNIIKFTEIMTELYEMDPVA